MSSRREPLPALTALRFFAALAIFVLHFYPVFHGTAGAPPVLSHLTTGVTFFFVLSGFILTYNYLGAMQRPTARGAWNFAVARWARIYPVHVFACLAILPLTYIHLVHGAYGGPRTLIAANVGLVQAFLPDQARCIGAFNPPSWSLSAEWFFYLCFPLLIPGLTTGSRARRAAVLALALAPWALALSGTFGGHELWRAANRDAHYFPPVRLADFVSGVLLGIWWHHRHADPAAAPRSVARATRAEVGAVLFLGAWTWACVGYATDPRWLAACHWGGLYVPPFALCIWVFARGGGLLSRALAVRPLVYLGEVSYAVYMLHWAVLLYSARYGSHVGFEGWSSAWKWAAVSAATLALSVACYHAYEIPLRDRLKRALALRRAEPPAAEAAPPAVRPEPPLRRAA